MKQFIALDIDGTITADPYKIPERVVQLFEKLYSEGWNFLFVTGRPFAFAVKTLSVIKFPYFFAVQNGSDLFKMPEKELIAKTYLGAGVIPKLDKLYEGKNEDFLIYAGPVKGDFCYYRPSRFSSWMSSHLTVVQSVSPEPWRPRESFVFEEEESFPLIKCLGTKEEMLALHKKLLKIPGIVATFIKDPLGKDVYLNLITDLDATKGNVVHRLRQMHPGSFFIAAGDDYNDLSMLENADIAIVMDTAPQDLLSHADIVAKSAANEGIIEALLEAIKKERLSMEVFLEEAQKRKMSEMALTAFRKRLSPQTGWIHLFIENALDARQDSIPLVENFLYVHALFRSKIAVNIQEGKALLERILAFEVSGNFPLYLHDYPSCHDPKLSSYFLAPLRYLLRDFSSVLGELLVQKLESLAGRILKYLETVSVSPLVEKRVLAYQGIFDSEAWNPESPTEWAEFCLCAQVAGKNPSKVFSVWDQNHFVFIGKVKERFQEGFEPLVTLLDLFMGEAYQAWSARALEENLVHLRASLVQPFREKPLASALKSCSALIEQDKKQSFTLYSGDQSFTSSLVLESKKGAWAIEEKNAGVFSFEYAYDPEVPSEEDSVEFAFYLSTLDDARVFVGGSRATLFQSGDLLEVPFQGVNLLIKITGVDGEWTGHISKGNRSFQRSPHVYAAYDWKIGFRTLRRGLGAKATIELRVG